jgi:signal transduction histidine kinase
MSAGHRISITARITLFTAAVAVLLSTLASVALMLALNRFTTAYLTDEITSAGGRVAIQVEQNRLGFPLARHPSRNIQVVDTQGRIIASTPQLQGKPVMAKLTPDSKNVSTAIVCGGVFPDDECNIVVAQSAHRTGGDWTVYSASPTISPFVDPRLAAAVAGGAVLLAAAITYIGHWNVAASLRPVNAIRAELDVINATNPGRRVPVPPGRDEIHDLAGSVNHTLTRLEAAMEQQRQFASDASHDLRSPIAAMRAEVEDALLAPQETNVAKVGKAIVKSLDRFEAIVYDLLTITRLDAGVQGARDPIDLAGLVADECRIRHKTDIRCEYSLEPGVVVIGDRLRLGRLVTNLIDNAERHADSKVLIRVQRTPSEERDSHRFPYGVAMLEVIDDGPGIEPDKHELVFQRFARLDAARNKDSGGSGLGLPIARQIAEATGGTLRIEDSARGARFVLRLPLHAEETA